MANIKYINGNPITASAVDLESGSVSGTVLTDGTVGSGKLSQGSVVTDKIQDGSVTASKLGVTVTYVVTDEDLTISLT